MRMKWVDFFRLEYTTDLASALLAVRIMQRSGRAIRPQATRTAIVFQARVPASVADSFKTASVPPQ